jgi:hypothetical protein
MLTKPIACVVCGIRSAYVDSQVSRLIFLFSSLSAGFYQPAGPLIRPSSSSTPPQPASAHVPMTQAPPTATVQPTVVSYSTTSSSSNRRQSRDEASSSSRKGGSSPLKPTPQQQQQQQQLPPVAHPQQPTAAYAYPGAPPTAAYHYPYGAHIPYPDGTATVVPPPPPPFATAIPTYPPPPPNGVMAPPDYVRQQMAHQMAYPTAQPYYFAPAGASATAPYPGTQVALPGAMPPSAAAASYYYGGYSAYPYAAAAPGRLIGTPVLALGV